jgi:hypothetical protein
MRTGNTRPARTTSRRRARTWSPRPLGAARVPIPIEVLNVELRDRRPQRLVVEGIRVRDVQISDKVRILNDPDTMVAVATFAKVEEEAAAVPGAEGVTPTSTEPEISVERGKKEDEGEE